MKSASYFRGLVALAILTISSVSVRSQAPAERPKIGLAILTSDGAPSAVSIGCLKALEELNVPIDLIAANGTGAFVAALYATGRTPEQIKAEFERLGDTYAEAALRSTTYLSDYRLRRLLTLEFGKVDLLSANNFSVLPISFSTSALDLLTGRVIVFKDGSLTRALRATLASPVFVEPMSDTGRLLISTGEDPLLLLRKAGADIILLLRDEHVVNNLQVAEWGRLSKLSVMGLQERSRETKDELRAISGADILVSVRASDFTETAMSSLGEIVDRGYRAVLEKKKLLEAYAVDSRIIAEKRSKYYQTGLAEVEKLTLEALIVYGNRYLEWQFVKGILGLKVGARFDLNAAVESMDKLYASGFVRTCWLQLNRTKLGGVEVVAYVKESEFLPVTALPGLQVSLRANDAEERQFAATAIGNLGPKARSAVPQLSAVLNDENRSVRSASVRALGAIGAEASSELRAILDLLKREKDPVLMKDAAWAIARIAVGIHSVDDPSTIPLLEDSTAILAEFSDLAEYRDSINLSLASLKIKAAERSSTPSNDSFTPETELPPWLTSGGDVSVNGQHAKVQLNSADSKINFLGSDEKSVLREGVNRIAKGREEVVLWLEERKLKAFENPYRNSFAVIVAIDDYDRKGDSLHRPPTGFPALTSMVGNAKLLAETLEKLGFPKSNIFLLFDQQATSKAVTDALESFWPGGVNAHADRLFFYFGGHGDTLGNRPFLATYDYNQSRPTLTSVLMEDLTDRESKNISARHVLFALDACDSGLSLKTLGDPEAVDQQLRRFQTLAVVRRDTEKEGRNILVAGTGDQRALWQNGGIFTRALIKGLQGDADLNRDGIIQFEELGVFIRNLVTAQAASSGVRQDPDFRILDQYGPGRMLFVK